jgi:hypothetical protein
MSNLWITFDKRPLFLTPKGGRCTQVWLYIKDAGIVYESFQINLKQIF